MPKDKIVFLQSIKVTRFALAVYKNLYSMSDFPLHVGLTEAGSVLKE